MMRRLVFTGEKAAARFEYLHEALMGFGDQKGERSRAVLRQEARLQDALDPVSEPDTEKHVSCDKCGRRANDDARRLREGLNDGNAVVLLKEEDHKLLSDYVDKRPWLPRVARTIVDLQDWLSSADKIEG